MHEARFRPHMFGEVGEEGEHVVLRHDLDFVDTLDLEPPARPHRAGGVGGNCTQPGLGVAGMGFDFEPDFKLGPRLPDADHFGAAVAGNHGPLTPYIGISTWNDGIGRQQLFIAHHSFTQNALVIRQIGRQRNRATVGCPQTVPQLFES